MDGDNVRIGNLTFLNAIHFLDVSGCTWRDLTRCGNTDLMFTPFIPVALSADVRKWCERVLGFQCSTRREPRPTCDADQTPRVTPSGSGRSIARSSLRTRFPA